MGRRKMDTTDIHVMIGRETLEEISVVNPSLLTRDLNGEYKFRHGALGKYIERLMKQDIVQRKKSIEQNLYEVFLNETQKEAGTN